MVSYGNFLNLQGFDFWYLGESHRTEREKNITISLEL